jgi:hypothetical protein
LIARKLLWGLTNRKYKLGRMVERREEMV